VKVHHLLRGFCECGSLGVLDFCYALVGVCVCDDISGSNCCAGCCGLCLPPVDTLRCVAGMYVIYCIRI
jgi:hypothetical protein